MQLPAVRRRTRLRRIVQSWSRDCIDRLPDGILRQANARVFARQSPRRWGYIVHSTSNRACNRHHPRRPDHGKITAAQIAEAKADYDAKR
jgi:hypothetical protein